MAHSYLNETYQQASLIRSALTAICLVYLACYVISLFVGNKRIMAEGMMVASVAYAGLALCPSLSPLQAALTSLATAGNPYNIFRSDSFRPFDDSLLPLRLRGTGLYSFFLYNLNSGLAFVLLPLLIGAVLLLVGACKCLG